MMNEFKNYKRTGLSEMRPYLPGEDLSKVSVNGEDMPEEGGMIARNPKDHADQWYVAEAYFRDNLELAVDDGKTLHNSDVSGARKNVPDIKVVGNGDMFALLCKASSEREGWMKSTKAMETIGGCVVQVTTQQRNVDGSYAVAEALTFVPGVMITDDTNDGRKLVLIQQQVDG